MLHLVCGKIAAGKSTLVARLGAEPGTVVVSEDGLLARLYPGEQETLADYARNSGRLYDAIAPLLVQMLQNGISLVLDFPANTPAQRIRLRKLFEQAGCAHRLQFLDVPDDVCKARLRQRNAAGLHEYTVSEEQFDQFTSHFVPPSGDEGFEVVRYEQ